MRNIVPRLVALADVLAIASYMVNVTPIAGQALGLGIKLLLLPLLLNRDSILLRQGEAFFLLSLITLLSLVFSNETAWLDVLPLVAFLLHLALSLLLRSDQLAEYLRSVAVLIAGSCVIYLLMAAVGQIPIIYGRYWYFNELHPNLGSEIAAAGALCGVITLRYRNFMALSAVMLANTVLMQGRAAMLTIGLAMVLRSLHEAFVASDARKVQFRIILLTPFAVILPILALPYLADALLLNDSYRGVGTGVVGRTEQWEIAWEAFLDRPITGQGIGWFERTQEMGAHNFFLYGFAEMGLMSSLLFGLLIYLSVTAYRLHGWKIVSLSPVLVMFMVNDRFMNLNPYPFMVWLLIFALSVRPSGADYRQPAPVFPGGLRRAAGH